MCVFLWGQIASPSKWKRSNIINLVSDSRQVPPACFTKMKAQFWLLLLEGRTLRSDSGQISLNQEKFMLIKTCISSILAFMVTLSMNPLSNHCSAVRGWMTSTECHYVHQTTSLTVNIFWWDTNLHGKWISSYSVPILKSSFTSLSPIPVTNFLTLFFPGLCPAS